jgi:DNA-directed RNA polymerase subunit RPC12/RpoP
MFSKQLWVCSKCSRQSDEDHVRGWLIDSSKDGEKQYHGVMVIRCPACITNYALRNAEHGRKAIR